MPTNARQRARPRHARATAALLIAAAAAAATPADAREVRVLRDDDGVPHVVADDVGALFHGVGYAVAQDRLWQADLYRRFGTGRAAELLGADAVAGDVLARTVFGPAAEREARVAAAPEELRTILDAYADGVNAWIDEATRRGRLPPEYAELDPPEPWRATDSIAALEFFAALFGWSGDDELQHAADLEALTARLGPVEGERAFADTHWLDDPDAPTTVPADAAARSAAPHRCAPRRRTAPAGAGDAARRYRGRWAAWQRTLDRFGLRRGAASNAVVLGGALTADGRPLLLAGPQMGFSVPSIAHEIGLRGAGFEITGIDVPGVPLVTIGVGRGHAWTLTSGGSDNADLYAEQLDPDDPQRYLHDGVWRSFDCRLETVAVRDEAPLELELCASVHGPVVDRDDAAGIATTLKVAPREHVVDTLAAWLDLGRARSLAEFAAALPEIALSFNVVYADVTGHAAYWHVGKVPLRAAGDDPWLPHDGTGGAEWQGFVPWGQMPRVLDPARGWLASWNNKPAPGWANSGFGFWGWGPVHRYRTLVPLLDVIAPASATLDTLAEINRTAAETADTPSGSANAVFVSSVLEEMVAAVDPAADPRLPEVVPLLEEWDGRQLDADGDGRYDDPAVALFDTWWEETSARIFTDELGGRPDPILVGNLVGRLLAEAPALPLRHDFLDGETVGAALTAALVDAVDRLELDYGSTQPADWLQPAATIRWEPLGAGRVADTPWMNRGTTNLFVQLAPGAALTARSIVPPGQSGLPASAHFADQLDAYATWQSKPMRLRAADLAGHVESVTRLELPAPGGRPAGSGH